MGARCSTELGEHGLREQLREFADIAVHRLNANDPSMTELALPNFGIGDDGVELGAAALEVTTHLHTLDLAFNGITARGARVLASALSRGRCGSSVLRELRLSGNPLGREGCRALCEWLDGCRDTCALQALYLFQCDLDDECALLLANTLQRQRSLTALNLDMNRFSKKTALMLAQALEHNRTLARLSFQSPLNVGPFPEATLDAIEAGLARNAELMAKRAEVEAIKAKKAQRRAEREAQERAEREAALADERRRVEEELAALEALKTQEDEQVRALEAKMAETVAKRNAKAAESQDKRQVALERAIAGAYEWRDKLTGHGTLQKEWRSGFTILKTEPGDVGGSPTVSADAPRRLRACWCDPQDATAPYAKTLHYHCKWEEARQDADDALASGGGGHGSRKGASTIKAAAVGVNGYMGCKSTGHVCASVGWYTKPRPDLSAQHFFACAHPGAAAVHDGSDATH